MIETLLAIVVAELGMMLLIAFGIIGIEFYSLYLRGKAMIEEQKLMRIQVSPEELKAMMGSGGLPKPNVPTEIAKEVEANKAKLYI